MDLPAWRGPPRSAARRGSIGKHSPCEGRPPARGPVSISFSGPCVEGISRLWVAHISFMNKTDVGILKVLHECLRELIGRIVARVCPINQQLKFTWNSRLEILQKVGGASRWQ